VDSKLRVVLRRVASSVTLSIFIIYSIKTIVSIRSITMGMVRILQLCLRLNS